MLRHFTKASRYFRTTQILHNRKDNDETDSISKVSVLDVTKVPLLTEIGESEPVDDTNYLDQMADMHSKNTTPSNISGDISETKKIVYMFARYDSCLGVPVVYVIEIDSKALKK